MPIAKAPKARRPERSGRHYPSGQHRPLSPFEDLIHDLLLKIGAHSKIDAGLADREGSSATRGCSERLLRHILSAQIITLPYTAVTGK
jgi:hypothetical protein